MNGLEHIEIGYDRHTTGVGFHCTLCPPDPEHAKHIPSDPHYGCPDIREGLDDDDARYVETLADAVKLAVEHLAAVHGDRVIDGHFHLCDWNLSPEARGEGVESLCNLECATRLPELLGHGPHTNGDHD